MNWFLSIYEGVIEADNLDAAARRDTGCDGGCWQN